MASAHFTIGHYQSQQGWDDGTMLDLLTEYIDNQNDDNALDDFFRRKADEDSA